jgi:hypothetical protein
MQDFLSFFVFLILAYLIRGVSVELEDIRLLLQKRLAEPRKRRRLFAPDGSPMDVK